MGRTEDGRSFGLNLTADLNNALENAAWVDGQLTPLATALFRYEPDAVLNEWRLFGAFESRFQQPFGRFEGTLRLNGQQVKVSGSGVVEQHQATW